MSDRIAMLFATSGHSGVDRVVRNLLSEFAHTPYRYDLLLIRGHGPHLRQLPDNVTVRRLRARHRNTVLPELCAYLWRHRPETLITASHKLNRAALLARRLTGVSTRVTIRLGMTVSAVGGRMSPRRRAAMYRSMRRWYPRADAVVVPSAGVGQGLMERAGVAAERLHVIRNPLVNQALHRLAGSPTGHPWLDAPDRPVVLGAGSLEPRKDFATLVRAFATFRRKRAARLVILGKGSQRQALLELAQRLGVSADVDLPGFSVNPYAYMRRASVFVLSSRREGASAVLVEALACGTPVVSTDCPDGPSEVLGATYPGLVGIGDDEAMSAALERAVAGELAVDRFGSVVQEHSTRTAAVRYLQALGVEPCFDTEEATE